MSEMKLVEFPNSHESVSEGLRRLADEIDHGLFDDAHNAVWVIDRGDAKIDVGILGYAAESAPTAYFLLGLAKRKLENIIND